MGMYKSASLNFQVKFQHSPKCRVNSFMPYVWILEPFAAFSQKLVGIGLCPGGGGITLISAPISTRKMWLLFWSSHRICDIFFFVEMQSSLLLAGIGVSLLLEVTGVVAFPGIVAEREVIPAHTALELSMWLPLSAPTFMVLASGL